MNGITVKSKGVFRKDMLFSKSEIPNAPVDIVSEDKFITLAKSLLEKSSSKYVVNNKEL